MSHTSHVIWVIDSMAGHAGTERQVVELGSRLSRQNFRLELIALEASPHDAHVSRSVPLSVYPVRRLWSPAGCFQLLKLAWTARRRKAVVVHGFMFKASLAAVIVGALAGTRVVITSRRNLGYYYNRLVLWMLRLANAATTRVLANSEAAKRVAMHHEKLPAGKVDVLYNAVDIRKFQEPGPASSDPAGIPIPAGKRVVGTVANYRPVKDLPLFLEAAAIVARQVPDAVFLLVGSGSQLPELEALAARLGIADRVLFTAGRGSVPAYLQQMHVACLCSKSEGFSNSILEYMAAGLPVVATDVGGNREAVEDGRTGFLVQDRSPESVAAPILRLLQDEELRVRLGKAGQEICARKFAIEEAAAELEEYYQSLIATGRPPDVQRQKRAWFASTPR